MRVGPARIDSQGDERIATRSILQSVDQGLVEDGVVVDDVVGRCGYDHCVRVPFEKGVGGIGQAGRRVAVVRFEQKVLFPELRKVHLDHFLVPVKGHHDDVFLGDDSLVPVVGEPQEGFPLRREVQELFRFPRPADGPEAGTDASGHDYTVIVVIKHMLV